MASRIPQSTRGLTLWLVGNARGRSTSSGFDAPWLSKPTARSEALRQKKKLRLHRRNGSAAAQACRRPLAMACAVAVFIVTAYVVGWRKKEVDPQTRRGFQITKARGGGVTRPVGSLRSRCGGALAKASTFPGCAPRAEHFPPRFAKSRSDFLGGLCGAMGAATCVG